MNSAEGYEILSFMLANETAIGLPGIEFNV